MPEKEKDCMAYYKMDKVQQKVAVQKNLRLESELTSIRDQYERLNFDNLEKLREENDIQEKSKSLKIFLKSMQESQEAEEKLNYITKIRKILSNESPAISAQGVSLGIDILMMDLIKESSNEFWEGRKNKLLYETTWILTNIAAGTSAEVERLYQNGCFTVLLEILDSNSPINVIEQIIWAIGNIAGDELLYKVALKDCLAIEKIIKKVNSIIVSKGGICESNYSKIRSLLCTTAWALGNFARKPSLSYEDLKPIFGQLSFWIDIGDYQLKKEIYWSMTFLLGASKKFIEDFLEIPNNLEQLIKKFKEPNKSLKSVIIRLFGAIALGNDKNVQVLIENGVHEILIAGIISPNNFTNKNIGDMIWVLGNIVVGTVNNALAIVNDVNFNDLCTFLATTKNKAYMGEGGWLTFNIFKTILDDNSFQINKDLMLTLIDIISNLIDTIDVTLFINLIKLFESVIQTYDNDPEFKIELCKRFDNMGGSKILSYFVSDESSLLEDDRFAEISSKILDKYISPLEEIYSFRQYGDQILDSNPQNNNLHNNTIDNSNLIYKMEKDDIEYNF